MATIRNYSFAFTKEDSDLAEKIATLCFNCGYTWVGQHVEVTCFLHKMEQLLQRGEAMHITIIPEGKVIAFGKHWGRAPRHKCIYTPITDFWDLVAHNEN